QQNGAHERMHKTLTGEAIRPPRATVRSQQRAFNAFRDEDNYERPHQALHGRPPGDLSRRSSRVYTGTPQPFEYPGHFIVKRVTTAGTFRFKTRVSCSLPTPSFIIRSAWKKSRMASGRSSVAACCSVALTNATTWCEACGRPGRTEDAAQNAASSVPPGREE